MAQAAALRGMSVQTYIQRTIEARSHRDFQAASDQRKLQETAPQDTAGDSPERGLADVASAVPAALADAASAVPAALADAATAVPAALAAGQAAASWRWELPQHPPAHPPQQVPSRARALIRAALNGRGLDGHGDVCLILISELVTNAVRHAGPGLITVQLVLDHRQLVCGVSDTSPEPPVPSSPGLDDEGGRGLTLLAELSSNCGWYQTTTGKTLWFAQHLHAAADNPSGHDTFPTTAGPAHPLLVTQP
ncbi:ATP-binding protein [Actinomadura fulvescens]|uniref:ATP-binding protein n=1 Tax=Actinomadura fulvescens TaxID=46160 RepID=UPI0031DF490C